MWKVTRQYLTPNSQECTDCQAWNHYQEMISGPIVTVTGSTGEQSILISSFHFQMEEMGPSVHTLFVSSVPQCVSSSACRKTFSFTAISATLSQLTPRKKKSAIPPKRIIKTYWFSVRKLEKDLYLSWHRNFSNINLPSANCFRKEENSGHPLQEHIPVQRNHFVKITLRYLYINKIITFLFSYKSIADRHEEKRKPWGQKMVYLTHLLFMSSNTDTQACAGRQQVACH